VAAERFQPMQIDTEAAYKQVLCILVLCILGF
jgi:hypothetical protein